MRKTRRQPAGVPLPSIKRTNRSGNPSESYHRENTPAVRQNWLHVFRRSRKGALELTVTEIRSIEAQVRKELYP